jgi:long-chain acyl-CoA synthetase
VSGAGQPQPHAVVVLSEEARAGLRNGGKQTVETDLMEHLKGVNQELDSIERLQFLSVVGDDWTAENGFLTPTMKIKRGTIEDRYKTQVAGWYAQNRQVVWADQSPNRP